MSRMKNGLAAVAVLLVACSQPGPNGGSADAKGPVAGERKLDLAGLTIGMDLPQATSVLKAAGWSIVTGRGYTWEQEVNNELSLQNVAGRKFDDRMKGIGTLTAEKGTERIEVTFHSAPSPRMGRISEVRYSAPAPGQTAQQMISGLAGRYGAPDRSGAPGFASGATWCVGGATCAGGRGFGTRTTLLGGQASAGGGGLTIRLSEGSDAFNAWRSELKTAEATSAGASGKPSY
jgi:hypothetical protein